MFYRQFELESARLARSASVRSDADVAHVPGNEAGRVVTFTASKVDSRSDYRIRSERDGAQDKAGGR